MAKLGNSPAHVTVVGAGVIGLTSAIRLLEAGFGVEIVALQRSPDTTSNVAAGLWYPYKAGGTRVAGWALATLEMYRTLADNADTGVRFVDCKSFAPPDEARPFWADADVDYSDSLDAAGPDGKSIHIVTARLPVAQSSRFMPWLESRVNALGGTIRLVDRAVTDISEVGPHVVVNCSGLGSRMLCDDPSVAPIRGAVVRMAGTGIEECIADDLDPDLPTYIIPGDGYCVLGGYAQQDRWDLDVTEEETRDIVARCARLDRRVLDGRIVGRAAGLRPGRPEVRLETETLATGQTVVHNYGHGGSGFTLAWGCADDATEMVGAAVKSPQ